MLNLTQGVIVFTIVAFIVVTLFCLAAWYFDRKNRYKYESALSEELDSVANNRIAGEQTPRKKIQKTIQMQLLTPQPPMNLARMSERAADSNRLSYLTPLNPTDRTSTNRNLLHPSSTPSAPTSKDTLDIQHTYVNKLANYTQAGIQLYQKDVTSVKASKVFRLTNWVDECKEIFKVNRTFYPHDSPNMEDIIDMLRFEECDYNKGVKWLIDVEIKNAQYDREYNVQGMVKRQYFEFITEEEFNEEVRKLNQV